MGTVRELLAGSDAQLAKSVKKLADRTMGAGGRDADPKAGLELIALFEAAEHAGDGRVVGTLAGDKDLQDIILYAAEHGHVDFVEALICAGVSPPFTAFGNLRPIYLAARHGQEAVIEALVRAGEDPSYDGFFATSVLLHAIGAGHLGAAGVLVRLGANVTARHRLSGSTPLVEAAAAGAGAELVRAMLERGADVNDPDDNGRTPLMAAADKGNAEAARALIEAGADVNAAERLRPIEAIDAENRDVPTFKEKFWRNMRAKQTDSLGTALMFAARNGHAEVVKALLDAGADAAARDARGRTAADHARANAHATVLRVLSGGGDAAGGPPALGPRELIAAAEAGDLRRVDEVLAAGVDVNAKPVVRYGEPNRDGEIEQTGGRPALVVAAAQGHVEVVERLLRAGAEIDARGDATIFDNGQAALHAAAEAGHAKVVRALLAAGANANLKEQGGRDTPGRTAMQIAVEHKRKAVIDELLRPGGEAKSDADDAGAKSKPKSKRKPAAKVTGLHEAAEAGDAALVERLIKAGAEVDAPASGTRWSPLMYACFMAYTDAATALLDAGAEANRANRLGQVALTVAVHGARMAPDVRPNSNPPRSYVKTVRLLLSRGADAGVDTWNGTTPLQMAKQSDLKSLAAILKDAKGKAPKTGSR